MHQLRAMRAGRRTHRQDTPAGPRVLLHAPLREVGRGFVGYRRRRRRRSRFRRRIRGLPGGPAARGSRCSGPPAEQGLSPRGDPPPAGAQPHHGWSLGRTVMIQAPDQRRGVPQPDLELLARRRRTIEPHARRQLKLRLGLRVIHILYTVWGHHTISSANGQDLYSAARAFSEG